MGHLALYREWRPQTFDEVVAQEQVVYPLKQAVISNSIGHAYLFSGTRGTGKTSLAKIFAKAVNCLEPVNGNPCNHCRICEGINKGSLLDVMEIDAASNNSVDNIRRITDEIVFTPGEARYKVYIIDEVHMLSQGAFNALLKTLEEPPAHAIFILATTEPQRIPATILSRCQRYEFRRFPAEDVVARLRLIADGSRIQITEEALQVIARLGDGALRDSISLLDQCRSGIPGEIGRDDVLRLAGIVQDDFLADFSSALFRADLPRVLAAIDELQMSGRNVQRFLRDFCHYLRNILICRITRDAKALLNVSAAEFELLQSLSALIEPRALIDLITRLSKLENDLRWSGDPRTALELELIAIMTSGGAAVAEISPPTSAERRRPLAAEGKASPAMPIPEAAGSDFEAVPESEPEPEPEPEQEPEQEPKPEPQTEQEPEHPGFKSEFEAEPRPASGPVPEPAAAPVSEPEFPSSADIPEADAGFHFPSDKKDFAAAADKFPQELPAEASSSESIQSALWDKVLDGLRKRFRIDLVMLLRPARIFDNGRVVRIVYDENLKAHCQTMRLAENRDLLREMLGLAGHATSEIQVELQGETPSAPGGEEIHNGQEAEPEWFRKLRAEAAESGLEVVLEKEGDEDRKDMIPPFTLPEDTDEIPF